MKGRFLNSNEAQDLFTEYAKLPYGFIWNFPIYDSFGISFQGQEYYVIDAVPGDINSPNGMHVVYLPDYTESSRYYWSQVNSGQPAPWPEGTPIQEIAGLERVYPRGYTDAAIVEAPATEVTPVNPMEVVPDPADIQVTVNVNDQIISFPISETEGFLQEISQSNPEIVDDVIEQIAEQTGIDLEAQKSGIDAGKLITWGAIAAAVKIFLLILLVGCMPILAQTTSSTAQRIRSYQGITTASFPLIEHTATWNNGAVTFTNIYSNIVDTASVAGSLLMDLRIGSVQRFTVTKEGYTTSSGGFLTPSTGFFGFTGQSRIVSGLDGVLRFRNAADTDFLQLIFGPANVEHISIATSNAVAGQAQGIIINRGDGTDQVFANLGAAPNGCLIYCADCTFANPCAGGGTGAYAKRLNGAWRCD